VSRIGFYFIVFVVFFYFWTTCLFFFDYNYTQPPTWVKGRGSRTHSHSHSHSSRQHPQPSTHLMPVQTRSQRAKAHEATAFPAHANANATDRADPLASLLPVPTTNTNTNTSTNSPASAASTLAAAAEVTRLLRTEGCLAPLPPTLRRLFELIGDPSKTTVLANRNWNVFSLHMVIDLRNRYTAQNKHCTNLDFATIYDGMGYYVVCSVCTATGALYYRQDGGSNAYDAEYNYRFASSSFRAPPGRSFTVDDWIGDVRNEAHVDTLSVMVAP
jgi:hypothetical protein